MQVKKAIVLGITVLTLSSVAYAITSMNPRFLEITEYKVGHTHDEHGTHGAAEHSGGTDKYGCHNASVPYHCH